MNAKFSQKLLSFQSLALCALLLAGVSRLAAQAPQVINYQGRIQNSGTNPPGPTLDFKFALVTPNGMTTHWSHDNTSVNGSEPAGFVTLPVREGLFSVMLGDTSIPGMTKSVSSSVFDHSDVRLRIWVRDPNTGPAFELLSPDQRMGSVGYAMMSVGLANGIVTQNKLGNSAVTEIKLADGAVTTPKLADGAVTAPKIGGGTVTDAALADGAVTTAKLATGAVTDTRLASAAVTSGILADSAVTGPKILNGVVTDLKLADGAVTTAKLGTNAVTTQKLLNGAVTDVKIADGGVTNPKLAPAAVTDTKLADNAVTSPKLVINSVTTTKITNGAVTTPKLGSDVLTLISSTPNQDFFGSCSNCATVSIYGVSNCLPAISLDGCASQVSVFDRTGSGRTMVLLEGQDAAGGGLISVRGTNASTLYYGAVTLAAESIYGTATVELRDKSFGKNTVEIRARDTNTFGGYLALSDSQGRAGVELLGGRSSTLGGMMRFYQDDGFMSVQIYGEASDNKGGWIGLYRPGAASNPVIELDASDENGGCGRITTQVLEITGGCDLSENFDIKATAGIPEPGMIVCIDPDNPGHLVTSARSYDPTVAGIVSGAGGVRPGMLMGQQGHPITGSQPVALTGRVYCLVDADQGAIRPGDLITTSDTPGHGMKASDSARSHGAIIGKAMTRLEAGKGLVLVLVSLH